MPESFFGPWHVELTHAASHFAQSLVVSGSDNADGRYDVAFGVELALQVQGSAWELALEFFPFGAGAMWEPSDVRRSTRFEPQRGLIVQLDGAARPPGSSSTTFNNVTLMCASTDPETNPIPAANPYDFTVPEHG